MFCFEVSFIHSRLLCTNPSARASDIVKFSPSNRPTVLQTSSFAMDNEISFPRGGITRKATGFSPVIDSIFPSQKRKKQHSEESRKRKRSEFLSEQHVDLLPTAANILTYEQIQEGMLILGCIRKITPFSIEVELPGKMCGKIQVINISDPYTDFLQQKVAEKDIGEEKDLARLERFFYVGQFVPTKVMEKSHTGRGTKLYLSLNPTDIYIGWNHRVMQTGLLIWAAVESELDHGYQLNVGISNCRIFLPHVNIPDGTTFVVGQPLWCTVQKCSINVAASTVTVSILKKHLETGMQNIQINLHHLVPGMQFDLNITKAVRNGLRVNFMNNCPGYVNEAYLSKSLDSISAYIEGQTVPAYLMYVQPTTKFCCFSLRNLKDIPQPQYTLGTIVKSKVISRTGNGVNIKLPNGEKGFVSFKRILREMLNKRNPDEAIVKKYAQDSSHQCRILDYQRFEQVYICTFEQNLLKEKIFRTEDAKLGELVNVKVKSITKEGLLVQLGKINAFIHNSHLSSAAFSENIKTKFKIGQNLQARVWSIDDRGVYLTHKQAFVNSDVCLTKIEPTVVNKQYPGIVVKNCSNGVLVIFYGGIRGWLSATHLYEFFGNNAHDMYYEGQVITPTIRKIRDNILDLVLDLPKPSKRKAFRVGDYVDGIVSKISKKGLELEVGTNNIKGFLPVNHLSSSLPLTSLLLHTYTIGDVLKDLLCISDRGVPILSLREAVEYKKRNLKVSKIEDLTKGELVRCSYESSYDSGIYVSIPFKPTSRKLKISTEELSTDSKSIPPFQPQQAVVAKVVAINPNTKLFKITARLEEVFSWDCEDSIEYLQQYLQDMKQIQLHLQKQDSPLGKLRLGQQVQCTVNNISDSGCGVLLEDNVQGFVPKQHCSKNMKRGKKLAGVVLWMNYKDKYAVVSVAENILKKMNHVQNGKVDSPLMSSVRGEVLMVQDDCILSITQSKQLVCLPTKMHINAFTEKAVYKEGESVKLIIVRKVDDQIIAIDRKLKHELKKKGHAKIDIRHLNKKRKIDSNVITNKRARLEQNSKKNLKGNAQHLASDDEQSDFTYNISECSQDNASKNGLNEEKCATEIAGEVDNFEEDSDESDGVDVTEEENSDDENKEESDDQEDYEIEDDDEVENENADDGKDKEDSDNQQDYDIEDDDEVENENTKSENKVHSDTTNVIPALPGVQNFFDDVDDSGTKKVCLEDSSDDEMAEKQAIATKKKLSYAERKALAQKEEERLRKKEIEIANCTEEPQNEEQFRMLLTGRPNSSELWAKYIAYCISNAEIHKARNIARTALEKIDLEETEERYNVWITHLNLENRYGDKNSFNQVFEEAVRCNDDLRIYMDVINILATAQKYAEMEEKVKKAKSKFKHESKMWHDIIRLYYKIGQCKEARNLQNAALKSVDKKAKHIDMIVQFAIMEFQYGENNHAEALFESILQSAPQRVDVWSTYTDQMIKKSNIDGTRRIFERAVTQSIPVKKMKTLFKKFKEFEVKYGSQERVDYVIELARKYVGLS